MTHTHTYIYIKTLNKNDCIIGNPPGWEKGPRKKDKFDGLGSEKWGCFGNNVYKWLTSLINIQIIAFDLTTVIFDNT